MGDCHLGGELAGGENGECSCEEGEECDERDVCAQCTDTAKTINNVLEDMTRNEITYSIRHVNMNQVIK